MENFENNNDIKLDEEKQVNTEINSEASAPIEDSAEIVADSTPETVAKEGCDTVHNPVVIGEVVAEKDSKASSRGLKVFALIMTMVILVSTACVAGYFFGKNNNGYRPKVYVNLDSKPADTDEMTTTEVYNAVSDSVVGIIVYNDGGAMSYASGVVYSEDGYIVTNDHIYSNVAAAKFKVYTQDGTEYDAEYVAGDTISDLAVLKIDSKGFKKATFGNSDEIVYGESVVAIGCPSEPTEKASITRGIVSAVDRRVQTTSSYSARLIQTDSPINPGSSGGALVNMYGQVVGITSAKVVSEDQEAVGYAIPTTTMKYIVEELIKNGKVVSRAKLGISYMAIDSISVELGKYKYAGLLVDSVSEDSDLYGKLKKGDIIVQINDIDIVDDAVVLNLIEQCRAGDKITVTFISENGTSQTLKATLRANVSESSYQSDINRLPQNPDANKDFNFPEGDDY